MECSVVEMFSVETSVSKLFYNKHLAILEAFAITLFRTKRCRLKRQFYTLCLFGESCGNLESPKFFPLSKFLFINTNRDIGPAVRMFANGPGDMDSIPGRVIPKTLKMELDTTLLNTQHYKVRFKGKVEQSWEWSSALPDTLV